MSKLILLIIVLLIAPSCKSSLEKRYIDSGMSPRDFMMAEQNRFYSELRSNVDSTLTIHFPSIIDTNNISLGGSPIGSSSSKKTIRLVNRIVDNEIIERFRQSCIASYPGDDPCVITDRFIESMKENIEYSLRPCLVGKYPILDFVATDYLDVSTQSRLSKDFEILVLGCKPYKNIPDSLITTRRHLVEKWEHGYSRGVAINE